MSTVKKILKENKGKVRFFFRHYPLDFHKDAHLAAQASMAAHAQGKFWPYHDLLFKDTSKLKRAHLDAYAKEARLDLKKFKQALDKKTYKKRVDLDMEEGNAVKVSGTPSFFVNGRKAGLKELGDLVKDELKRTKKLIEEEGLKGDALYKRLLEGSKSDEPAKKHDIFVGDSPSQGPYSAHATVVAFGDFKCGTYTAGGATLLQVYKAYKDKVRIVFKHHPHHPLSQEVAQAAAAAHELGLFWQYYDRLIANRDKLDRQYLVEYAKEIGISKSVFQERMDSATAKAMVDADEKQAKTLEIGRTVAFYVNGVKVPRPSSFGSYKKLIDKILMSKGFKEKDLPKGPPPVKITVGHSPAKGAKDAPVLLAEFSDFQ